MDFQHSAKAQDYIKRVKKFIKDEIDPVEEAYLRELHSLDNKWVVLPIVEELKEKAKAQDRKSTRLNSSHVRISYAVFCLKKKKKTKKKQKSTKKLKNDLSYTKKNSKRHISNARKSQKTTKTTTINELTIVL